MTEAKDLYDKANQDFVAKISEIVRSMQMANEYLGPLKKRVEEGSDEKAKLFLSQLAARIQESNNLASQTKVKVDSVKELLELKKISYEAREIASRSWPKKTWIERLTWVATALFPSGGVPFVLSGGVTEVALASATVIWSAATVSLIISLWALKNEDDRKRAFFKREFDIVM